MKIETENKPVKNNLDYDLLESATDSAREVQKIADNLNESLSQTFKQIRMPSLSTAFIDTMLENQTRIAELMQNPIADVQKVVAKMFQGVLIPSNILSPEDLVFFTRESSPTLPTPEINFDDEEEKEFRRLILEDYYQRHNKQQKTTSEEWDGVEYLKATIDGGFKYKNKFLVNLSIDSKEGRLLLLFLQTETRFLVDDHVLKELNLPGNRDYGFVIRNLKKRFKKNGLEAIFERRKQNKGYVLIDINQRKKYNNRLKT